MLELGKRQTLKVVRKTDFGVYLAESADTQERVLLPKKEVPEGTSFDDEINVFLYKDSQGRLISTTRDPMVHLNEVAVLKVTDVSKVGAFLDWGLERDLFLPFAEQKRKVRVGEEALVRLYIDKSGRLAASMDVYEYLQKDAPYKKDDMVKGRIYEISENFGVFVAIDDKYSALIPKKEATGKYRIGDEIEARVTAVKADGKIDLSDKEKIYIQMDKDAETIMMALEEYSGVLPFSEKANPEVIKRELGLSKAAFKRAVGRLWKEGRIELTDNKIRKADK